jgi:hypothetical protein
MIFWRGGGFAGGTGGDEGRTGEETKSSKSSNEEGIGVEKFGG